MINNRSRKYQSSYILLVDIKLKNVELLFDTLNKTMVNSRKNECYLCLYNKSEKYYSSVTKWYKKLQYNDYLVPTHDGSDSFKLQPTNHEHLIIFDTRAIVIRSHKTQKNLLV